MVTFDKQAILERKAQLEQMLQEAANEYQRLLGAIQFCDALVRELDTEQEQATEEKEGAIP